MVGLAGAPDRSELASGDPILAGNTGREVTIWREKTVLRRYAVGARSLILVPFLLLLVGCLPQASAASKVLLDVDGRGDVKTANFATFGAWDLTYAWDCTTAKSQGTRIVTAFGMIVFNADDDSTVEQNAEINKTALTGSGSSHYTRPGQYYARVSSKCTYRVKVIDRSS
jgi:hypothetical protein